MIEPRTPSHRTRTGLLALTASLTLLAGCGGEPPMVDTAETIRPDPAKTVPAPAPAPAPVATPATTPEATPPKS